MKNYTISIIGEQESPEEEREFFELITDGAFSRRGNVMKISYFESDVTGADESLETTFIVEPERITLRRGAWFGADMVFDESEKHHFLYPTPMGAFTMGVQTETIRKDLGTRGGWLFIKYALDVDDIVVSHHTFRISIEPFENTVPDAASKDAKKKPRKRAKKQGDIN